MNVRANRIDWLIFLALGFMWGSSYLFIKLAVDDFGTFTPRRAAPARRGGPALDRRPARPSAAAARSADLRPPAGDGDHQHHDPVPAHHLGRAVGRIVARGHPDLAGAAVRDRAVGAVPPRRTDPGQRPGRPARRVHRGGHHRESRAHRRRVVASTGELALLGATFSYAVRRGLLAAQCPRAAADDPGRLPGDVRGDHHGRDRDRCSSNPGRRRPDAEADLLDPVARASSARGSRTCSSSGSSPTGAPRGPRSSPTSSRSSGSSLGYLVARRNRSTRGSSSGRSLVVAGVGLVNSRFGRRRIWSARAGARSRPV